MANSPQIFHGEWWVPAIVDYDMRMVVCEPEQMMGHEKKYIGTLTYCEDEVSTLEFYHVPSNFRSNLYCQNQVIWGQDANGHLFTLFDVEMQDKDSADFSNTKFEVDLILVGAHVLSLDDMFIGRCVVQFPYLRNWAFHDNLTIRKSATTNNYVLNNVSSNNHLVESQIEGNVRWLLKDRHVQNKTKFDLSISQMTEFVIESTKDLSIRECINHIFEFSQFLSIALYCEQSPSAVSFYNNKTKRYVILFFKKKDSIKPKKSTLVKFNELKAKMPEVFQTWHKNYDNISPISNYLIESLHEKNTFDVPDFLIIAQALDGFYKRFVNKKDGKDHRKYEDGIKILLEQFKDVGFVQQCHIDPKILKDSRDKFSHLYPDDEESSAVEGEDLYWLTEKCKILLTCCILNLMGLTNEEINLCFSCSPVQEFIISHLFEFSFE